MKLGKIIGVVVLCVGALLCGAFLTLVSIRRPWITPVPGVRLTPERSLVVLSELGPDSAFRLLVKAADFSGIKAKLTPDVGDRIRTQAWSEVTFSNVVVMIEEAQTNLALFARAVAAEDLRAPLPPDFRWAGYPDFRGTHHIEILLTASALRRASAGDCAAALEDVKMLMRGGTAIGFCDGPAGLYRQTSYCQAGCTALRRMARREPIAQPALREALAFLDAFEQELIPWPESVRMGHAWVTRMLPAIYKMSDEQLLQEVERYHVFLRRFAPLMGSNPETTQESMDALYSHAVAIAERPYTQGAYGSLAAATTCSPWELLISADPFGRVLAQLALSSFEYEHSQHTVLRAELGLTRLCLAVSLHRAQHGAPPATAAVLTPEFLAAIPVDPFHAPDALRYVLGSNGTWLAYSVGRDGADDGGQADAGGDGPDIAVSSESDLLRGAAYY